MRVRRCFLLHRLGEENALAPYDGEELPGPGNSARQRTFSFVVHLSGTSFSVDTPVPSGPRQAGQLPAGQKKILSRTRALGEIK